MPLSGVAQHRRRLRRGARSGERRDPRGGGPDERVDRQLERRRRHRRCARVARPATSSTSFGQIGTDPGAEWGTGLTSTSDNTLRRKATICAGDTNGGNAFDPALQWDGYAVDTFGGFGAHSVSTCDDVPPPVDAAPTVASVTPAAEHHRRGGHERRRHLQRGRHGPGLGVHARPAPAPRAPSPSPVARPRSPSTRPRPSRTAPPAAWPWTRRPVSDVDTNDPPNTMARELLLRLLRRHRDAHRPLHDSRRHHRLGPGLGRDLAGRRPDAHRPRRRRRRPRRPPAGPAGFLRPGLR